MCGIVLDYITYLETSTISLNFWLNWFFDKLDAETNAREVHPTTDALEAIDIISLNLHHSGVNSSLQL